MEITPQRTTSVHSFTMRKHHRLHCAPPSVKPLRPGTRITYLEHGPSTISTRISQISAERPSAAPARPSAACSSLTLHTPCGVWINPRFESQESFSLQCHEQLTEQGYANEENLVHDHRSETASVRLAISLPWWIP